MPADMGSDSGEKSFRVFFAQNEIALSLKIPWRGPRSVRYLFVR